MKAWTRISKPMKIASRAEYREIAQWCRSTYGPVADYETQGVWTTQPNPNSLFYDFYFKHAKDATLFLLRWPN